MSVFVTCCIGNHWPPSHKCVVWITWAWYQFVRIRKVIIYCILYFDLRCLVNGSVTLSVTSMVISMTSKSTSKKFKYLIDRLYYIIAFIIKSKHYLHEYHPTAAKYCYKWLRKTSNVCQTNTAHIVDENTVCVKPFIWFIKVGWDFYYCITGFLIISIRNHHNIRYSQRGERDFIIIDIDG